MYCVFSLQIKIILFKPTNYHVYLNGQVTVSHVLKQYLCAVQIQLFFHKRNRDKRITNTNQFYKMSLNF